jgi:hypothetical protein
MVRLVDALKRGLGFLMMAAFISACAAPQRQYQSAASNLGSEECRALQAVIEDRERYDIVAPSRDADEAALRQCVLSHSSGGQPTIQQIRSNPPVQRPDEVQIERRGGAYYVPVRINGTITLPFLLDTGATDMVIPADVARTLIRAGVLTSRDFIGKSRYRLADGSEGVSDVVSLRELQVGEHFVRNVTASISPLQGEPLLGQKLPFEVRYGDPRL